jgi:solute carrier family 19 (thiamine transporter), member 2/3
LVILSVLEGFAVLLAAQTSILWISYLGYILFGTLYAFTITVVSAEVAKNLTEDSFGLVFGINTLVALILQTILTILVVSENGFRLDAVGQFSVYGYYYVGVGAIYLVALLVDVLSGLIP